MIDAQELEGHLLSLDFSNDDRQVRLVAVLSAALAVCRDELTAVVLSHLERQRIDRQVIYETILQSYLFLGFPRMIEAALVFNRTFGDMKGNGTIKSISPQESEAWYNNGQELCRQVYGKNYEVLKDRFMSVSPEIFRWMVIEGYGKVLSRPGMTQIERELAEVAVLIVDKRKRQLTSHILGSLNVGADMMLIKRVNEDIKPLAGVEGFDLAGKVIQEIEKKYETTQ